MGATVDYLFAFAATAKVVSNRHFEQLFESYLKNVEVRDFITNNNSPAMIEICDRFHEAIERGFWHPKSNSVIGLLNHILAQQKGTV